LLNRLFWKQFPAVRRCGFISLFQWLLGVIWKISDGRKTSLTQGLIISSIYKIQCAKRQDYIGNCRKNG
jgi:hypothetical protein